jgi:hypothetical protein
MTAIITLLTIMTLAILVTRIASMALVLTGVSRELARFQARSAFTAVGYTTSESEAITTHPVRRRIISMLMLLGSAGIVTVIASLAVSLVKFGEGQTWLKIVVLGSGLSILWWFGRSEWVARRLNPLIRRALKRWTRLDVSDFFEMLHLADDYTVVQVEVEEGDWLTTGSLDQLRVHLEGVLVLGLARDDGRYVGAPGGETTIQPGDRAILYGRIDVLEDLATRPEGMPGRQEHRASVEEEEARREAERAREERLGAE